MRLPARTLARPRASASRAAPPAAATRQVVPMEDINLHFTGDIHADRARRNNLLAADASTTTSTRATRSSIDPATHHLATRDGHERPRAARDRRRPRRQRERRRRARTASTSPSPPRSWRSSASRTTSQDLKERARPHRRRPTTCDGKPVTAARPRRPHGAMTRAAQGRDQAEPRADARGQPGLHPRRPVRQHRARLQLRDRRPRSR
ncbi:MAG: formate--tetrahydrofolate ligase [Candidatus Moduliflexus flocculans]|nr:formate--tetrahydrofolate ligase [Candidatus Moduliflexus flocculans]